MKDKYLRELTPYITFAMLISASVISEHVSAEGVADVNKTTFLIPKNVINNEVKYNELNKSDIMILPMSKNIKTNTKEYTCLKGETIDSIVYSDDGLSLTIYLLDSDIYYIGHYDEDLKQYLYEEKTKQYVKK